MIRWLFGVALIVIAAVSASAQSPTGQTAPVSTSVTVASAAGGTQLIAANGGRHGITFYNQGAQVVSILPGTGTPTASGGGTINIAANGGMLTLTCDQSFPCGNAFQAIAAASTSIVSVWEY